jgi:4'-phosphopantetheinyl transferase
MQEFSNFTFEFKNDVAQIFVLPKDFKPLNKEVILCAEEIEPYENISSPSRKIEFLLSRHLRNIHIGKIPIVYAANGKPFLKNRIKSISISHSNHYLALMISDNPCAIDLEEISHRAEKVKEKFLTSSELKLLNQTDFDFTRAWTIKEVLYKSAEFKIQSYTNELVIDEIDDTVSNCRIKSIFEERPLKVYTEYCGNLIISFNFEES